MQINCVISTNSLKQTESTRWRKKTMCKYHTLSYMPEIIRAIIWKRYVELKSVEHINCTKFIKECVNEETTSFY